MSEITADTLNNPDEFSLYGSIHSYEIPGSNFLIRYFQSAIRPQDPHGQKYVENVRPVREILDPSNIKEMDQIIQRELDDQRIVSQLVPYILNINKNDNSKHDPFGISFFPSILGVLMPKNFLIEKTGGYSYPYPLKNDEITTYLSKTESKRLWEIKQYKSPSGATTPLCLLKVNFQETDAVVIDGQHRINAFRAALGEMKKQPNPVIREIYKNVDTIQSKEFDLSIPVTFLWFESKDSDLEVEPQFISRKLFIDVNNSAKPIGKSRKILLDDSQIDHITVGLFYSEFARTSNFRHSEMSLVHLGYDCPHDLRAKTNLPFTLITTPDRLRACFTYFLLNLKTPAFFNNKRKPLNKGYSYTERKNDLIKRQEIMISFPDSYINIETSTDDYLSIEMYTISKANLKGFQSEFESKYLSCFKTLVTDFGLFNNYVNTIYEFHKDQNGNWSGRTQEAWEMIYFGGTSMYYNISDYDNNNNRYKDDISTLEKEFIKFYAAKYNLNITDCEDLRGFMRSIAFQVGLFVSFYTFCKVQDSPFEPYDNDKLIENLTQYLKRVNAISESNWLGIYKLTKIGSSANELSPNLWPSVEKLIIRRIQEEGEFFDIDSRTKFSSPEAFYYTSLVSNNFKAALTNLYGLDEIAKMNIKDAIESIPNKIDIQTRAITDITEMYKSAGITFNKEYLDSNEIEIEKVIIKNVSALKPRKLRKLDQSSLNQENLDNEEEYDDESENDG